MEFHERVCDGAVVSQSHTNRNFVWASCVLISSYECLKRRPARHQKQVHIQRHACCVVNCSLIFRCGRAVHTRRRFFLQTCNQSRGDVHPPYGRCTWDDALSETLFVNSVVTFFTRKKQSHSKLCCFLGLIDGGRWPTYF